VLDRGVGFVLNGDGIACIDLDHCITGGVLADWAADIVARAGKTFVEVSPSGTGLHIWGFAEVGRGRRMGQVEVYDRGRYMTVTGNRWGSSPKRLGDISALVADLVGE
jgi:primase-polymerase (primpol)-like protein